MQLGAIHALEEGGTWLEHAREAYRDAGYAVADALTIDRPSGGTFLFFDASRWLPSDAVDCLPFLERALEAGVLLTPGTSCGRDYATWARICFTSVPPEELTLALERLRPVLGEPQASHR
jgi:N-succinyldiaminopimelate aminotransferase